MATGETEYDTEFKDLYREAKGITCDQIKDLLRKYYTKIVNTIDLSDGLLAHLYCKEVLCDRNKEIIQRIPNTYEQNEKLLDILRKKRKNKILIFLEAISEENYKRRHISPKRTEIKDDAFCDKVPYRCRYYGGSKGCGRSDCTYLHLCWHWSRMDGCFKRDDECMKSHELYSDHNKNALEKHGIDTSEPAEELLKKIRKILTERDDKSNGRGKRNESGTKPKIPINNKKDEKPTTPSGTKKKTCQGRVPKETPERNTRHQYRGPPSGELKPSPSSKDKKTAPQLMTPADESKDTICADYLHGECLHKNHCPHYHYSHPFLWQYKIPPSWTNFCEDKGKLIETMYTDVSKNSYPIRIEGESMEIDFTTMKAKNKDAELDVRRLSTESVTQWCWYWKDQADGTWKLYDGLTCSQDIEKKYIDHAGTMTGFAGQEACFISFRDMTQKIILTNEVTPIRRRPQKRMKDTNN